MKKLIIILASIVLASCSERKIGYVNLQTVFNDFAYKKELEKELKGISNNRKYILDSLETQVKMLIRKIQYDKTNKDLIAEYQTMKEIYLQKKTVYGEEEQRMVKLYDEKILSQLNSYIKEYGKKEKLDMIYGANNAGNVMYADTSLDLTKPVVMYINEKFKGKN